MTLRIGSKLGRFEMVHDLLLTAPGRRSRTIRILVASDAYRTWRK